MSAPPRRALLVALALGALAPLAGCVGYGGGYGGGYYDTFGGGYGGFGPGDRVGPYRDFARRRPWLCRRRRARHSLDPRRRPGRLPRRRRPRWWRRPRALADPAGDAVIKAGKAGLCPDPPGASRPWTGFTWSIGFQRLGLWRGPGAEPLAFLS